MEWRGHERRRRREEGKRRLQPMACLPVKGTEERRGRALTRVEMETGQACSVGPLTTRVHSSSLPAAGRLAAAAPRRCRRSSRVCATVAVRSPAGKFGHTLPIITMICIFYSLDFFYNLQVNIIVAKALLSYYAINRSCKTNSYLPGVNTQLINQVMYT